MATRNGNNFAGRALRPLTICRLRFPEIIVGSSTLKVLNRDRFLGDVLLRVL